MPERIIADTNVHDGVAEDPNLQQLITRCEDAGLIAFSTTHLQLGELAEIPDDRDIGQAAAINAEKIGPSVVVWGHSKWDEDRFGSPETNAAFNAIQKSNPKHTKDAMIGATATTDADILVTNDARFRKKFEALGTNVKAMSSAELVIHLTALLARLT
jgi:hypothetical protein